MRVYLDVCCLKRPFDDPSHERIRIEREAVLTLLGSMGEGVGLLHSRAQDLENAQNPLPRRRARVQLLLESMPLIEPPDEGLVARTGELMALGFKGFDALHLASAELGGAEVFATCDDRLLATARRQASSLRVRVMDPVELAEEVFQ